MAEAEATGSAGIVRAPAMVERFVKLLNIAHKAVRFYPESSDIRREAAADAVALLRLLLEQQPVIEFVVMREGLSYEGKSVLPESPVSASFARDLYMRKLSEVRFHSGCSEMDIVRFLTVVHMAPEELMSSGGFETALWELDVTAITVVETAKRIVDEHALAEPADAAEPSEPSEPWPPAPDRLDEIVAAAAAGQPHEQRLLVRMLKERELARDYVGAEAGEGGRPPSDAVLSARVEALARGVQSEVPEERDALIRQIAEVVLGVDPQVRQRLVAKRLLGDAKRDEVAASVLRQMTFDELMDCVLNDMTETAESRTGLSRAIRYLSLIGLSSPQESVLEQAASAMRERGASDEFVASVIDRAAPRRLDLYPRAQVPVLDPVESVLRIIDLTPDRGGPHAYDESVAALREEAARGVTDGDVVATLVSIATLETRPEHASRISLLVEDRIAYLLDQQEFEVAADAAATLTAAEQNGRLPAVQRRRMRELLQLLSKPESMRKLTEAMRVFRHDSPEHEACRRLLGVLGSYTVSSLLEVLAEEQDMAGRKALVDLLSGMADRFVPELGARLDDPRWYFVRNVVAILGSTHDPECLPHLGRTLRHPDERVRRETIRAIAGIRDALATEMLVAALADESAQNVQLAARYLGGIGGRGVLPALEHLARGEGRGNRDTGPRIEAIEALGRVGSDSSLRVLDDIAQQRGLLAGRTREVRTAAEVASEALRARGTDEGALP